MSEKPISPLRRRMIEDMTVRNFVEKTHNDYIRHVRTFTTFLGRAPDTAGPEDLRLFQLHQTQTGVGASGINGSVAALRFFFTVTLDRPALPLPAVSFIEGFRTPATVQAASLRSAGIRNPQHKRTHAPQQSGVYWITSSARFTRATRLSEGPQLAA
jgi:hypothetical protein